MKYLSETYLEFRSWEVFFVHYLFYSCPIALHKAWQWYCCALYKISKWLEYWNGYHGMMGFHEVWVEDEFRMDIIYCTAPQIYVISEVPWHYEVTLRSMSVHLTDHKSTLVQIRAWCRQATSYCLSQCWPKSMLPYGITRPQWVDFCHFAHNS